MNKNIEANKVANRIGENDLQANQNTERSGFN